MTNWSNSNIYRVIDLKRYSFDHAKIKQLIDLITVMPPDNASHNRGHK
jgi:hypothetical protein